MLQNSNTFSFDLQTMQECVVAPPPASISIRGCHSSSSLPLLASAIKHQRKQYQDQSTAFQEEEKIGPLLSLRLFFSLEVSLRRGYGCFALEFISDEFYKFNLFINEELIEIGVNKAGKVVQFSTLPFMFWISIYLSS